MSLDVYLTFDGEKEHTKTGIFFREEGQTKELTQEEWNEKFPDRVPVVMTNTYNDGEVYHNNITHNLGKMADEAELYKFLWRPDEIGVIKAKQLIEPLKRGLTLLRSDPYKFKKFDAKNKWGIYENLVDFVADYLVACVRYPEATVSVSR